MNIVELLEKINRYLRGFWVLIENNILITTNFKIKLEQNKIIKEL